MRTLKYYTKAPEVVTLCEMLYKQGYNVIISDSFSLQVDAAVKEFQKKNNLVIDGIVGMKTWQTLFEKNKQIININDKFLSEQDLLDFANYYDVELATVKAVNEVESAGKGFLIDGKPKILFEGHVFWKELKKRGINPQNYLSGNGNILYQSWTKAYYEGGVKEYDRLNKAIKINKDAALSSASWGCFQIMGYHAENLGYTSVESFVDKMYLHEREHLKAFGKFLEVNNLIKYLKSKNWAEFAKRYNGSGYAQNKYDQKLAKAYQKYS